MTRVAVLFGGSSSERLVSCASAQHIVSVLSDAESWFWGKDGSVSSVERSAILNHQDVFVAEFVPSVVVKKWPSIGQALDDAKKRGLALYLGLHGGDGENGWLQSECERRRLPFTGSGSGASALSMDKTKAKDAVRGRGLKLAEQYAFQTLDSGAENLLASFQSKHTSIVLKPSCEGSSAGLSFLNSNDELTQWWRKNHDSKIAWLAEEYLQGRELTVGVIMFRGCLSVLPPSEVILERNAKFDYQGKYLGVGNREITPAELTISEQSAAQEVAILAHTALGCFGYTRTDMMLTERGMYFLETNTLPGLTSKSFIPQQLKAAGIEMREFFEGQLDLARRRS